MRLTTHTLANEVHTVTNIIQRINTLHLEDVCLVVGKVRVGLDFLCHLIQAHTVLQLDIHHATMYAFTHGNSHRESILHALLAANTNAMTHAAARTEIRIGKTLGSKALHQRADNAVTAWVPTCRDNAHSTILLCCSRQTATQVKNRCVNIEAVHRVDTQSQAFQRVFLDGTCRRCQYRNIHFA